MVPWHLRRGMNVGSHSRGRVIHVPFDLQPSVEVSETGSAATSPLPLSEGAGIEGKRLDNVVVVASAVSEAAPSRKGQQKKWSFKRNKSDGQQLVCVYVCVCVCVCVCVNIQ